MLQVAPFALQKVVSACPLFALASSRVGCLCTVELRAATRCAAFAACAEHENQTLSWAGLRTTHALPASSVHQSMATDDHPSAVPSSSSMAITAYVGRRRPGSWLSPFANTFRDRYKAEDHGYMRMSCRRTLFIKAQPTPNPESMMFMPGRTVLENGTYDFQTARSALVSPLAIKLFAIDGVAGVFLANDFVTVTKKEDVSWSVLKPHIFATIMDFFASGEPMIKDDVVTGSSTAGDHVDDEVVSMIKELLETRIRPAVQEDGGDILFRSFNADTGTVLVKMVGACSGCPSSTVTLKSGIENMLMHYIPEVKEVVEDGLDEYEEEGVKEFNKLEQSLSP